MAMTRAVSMMLALAACGDPSISVVFDVDEEQIQRLAGGSSTLRIYHPLPAAPFDCDQLAFGEVDPEVLRLSLISEISLAATSEGPLEVDRVASKLFWAEGLDRNQRRLVTGCAEQGEITGDTEVVIVAEPTKLISVVTQPSLSLEMGLPLESPIEFQVTDLDRRPLDGVEVRWEIDGAGGSGSNGSTATATSGRALILPDLPVRPGPFVLDVAIRWAEQDPEPVTGFVHPRARVGTLPARVYDYRGGLVGPNAEPGFVALIDGTALGTYQVAHVYQNAAGEMEKRFSEDIATSLPQLGLIDPENGGERARAIVVGIDDWTEVGVDGALTPRVYSSQGLAPVAIEMSGSCEPGSPPQIFISYELEAIGIFNAEAEGELFTAFVDLIASGCVTDEVAGLRRILILEDFERDLFVGALVGNEFIGQYWLAVPNGIGFAPSIGSSTDSLLLGTQLSVNDVVISRYVVRSGQMNLMLVERGLDSPNGLPLFTDGGDIDGDELLDVASLLDQRVTIDDPPRFAIFSALGRMREGKRITGDFPIASSATLRDPEMILVDFDRDGSDDVVIAERTAFEPAGVETRFEVYEMGELTPE
jgi:hypothetical protein